MKLRFQTNAASAPSDAHKCASKAVTMVPKLQAKWRPPPSSIHFAGDFSHSRLAEGARLHRYVRTETAQVIPKSDAGDQPHCRGSREFRMVAARVS